MLIFKFSIEFSLHGTLAPVSNSLFDPNCIFAIRKSDLRLNQTNVELNLGKMET
jgi:hypothetical protein